MMKAKTLTPTETLNGGVLDARVSPLLGKELDILIKQSMERQNTWFALSKMPDVLKVTQKQFASLNDFTEAMYNTTDRFFNSGYNVMEVEIDREIDTITEIDDIMEDVEQYEKNKGATDEQTMEI